MFVSVIYRSANNDKYSMRLLEDFLDSIETDDIIQTDISPAERDGKGSPSLKRHQYEVRILIPTNMIYSMKQEEFVDYKTKTLNSVRMLMRQCTPVSSYSAPVLTTDNQYALNAFPHMFDAVEIDSFGGIFVIVSFDAQFRNTQQIIRFFGMLYAIVMGRQRAEDGDDKAICGKAHLLYGAMHDASYIHYRTTFGNLLALPEMFRPELRTYHDIVSLTNIDNDYDLLENAMRVCNSMTNRRPKKIALPKSLNDAISDAQITRIHASTAQMTVMKLLMYHRSAKEINVGDIETEDPYDSKSPVVLHTIRALHERPMVIGNKWMLKTTQEGNNIHFLASLPVIVCNKFVYNTCICVAAYRSMESLVEFVRILNGMMEHALGDERTVAEIIYKKSRNNG